MGTQADILFQTEQFCYQGGEWTVDSFPILDSEQTLVIIFGAPSFGTQPLAIQQLIDAYPKAHIIGCSTAGEIFNRQLLDESLSVAVLRFGKTDLRTAYAEVSSAGESFEAGIELANKLNSQNLKGIFLLSDGLQVNGSELVSGLNTRIDASVVITGGLAADGDRFESTWIIKEGQLEQGYVSALGFYGDHVELNYGVKGGWDIFGPERRVSKSKGNVVYEIDDKPALELYKRYLGDLSEKLPSSALRFPLAMRNKNNPKVPLVRTILAIDEETQSMTFAGDVPENATVQLMKANVDRLIDGAAEAAMQALRGKESQSSSSEANQVSGQSSSTEALCIAISCVGRRLVLGEYSEEELEASLDVLPKETKQIGFYSYGELSPSVTGTCELHNQTMTLTVINEK